MLLDLLVNKFFTGRSTCFHPLTTRSFMAGGLGTAGAQSRFGVRSAADRADFNYKPLQWSKENWCKLFSPPWHNYIQGS